MNNVGEKTMTMGDLKKSGLKIKDSKKVNMKLKCLRMIDHLIELMYSPGALKLMQKQGYSVEPEDITRAKKSTKAKLISRHLGDSEHGMTTKRLTGAISNLKSDINKFNF